MTDMEASTDKAPLNPRDIQSNGYSTLADPADSHPTAPPANSDPYMDGNANKAKKVPDHEVSNGMVLDCIEILTCRTDRERSQGMMVLVLLVVAIVFSIGIVLQKHSVDQYKTDSIVCDTGSCAQTSAWMVDKMNESRLSCEDFYMYACGSWVRGIGVLPEMPSWTTLDDITHQNYIVLNDKLKATGNFVSGRSSKAIQEVKSYYAACMDLSHIEQQNSKPLTQLLEELGGWPVLSADWEPTGWEATRTLVELNRLAVTPFFKLLVGRDMKNVNQHITTLSQSGLTLDDSPLYYKNDIANKIREAFIVQFVEIVEHMGKPRDDYVKNVANEVWNLEQELAKIFVPEKLQQDPRDMYNLQTVKAFDEKLGSSIDFHAFLESLFDKSFPRDTVIIVKTPGYFQNLSTVLLKTTKHAMANYMMWLLVESMVPYMSMRMRTASLTLDKVMTGAAEFEPQWLTCVREADSAMKYATGVLFSQTKLGKEWWDIDRVSEIIQYSKTSIQDNIGKLEWMDKDTKQKAYHKVENIKYQLGFPLFIMNATELDMYYAELVNMTNDLFSNQLKVRRFSVNKNLKLLDQLPSRKEWPISIVKAEAVNNYMDNELLVPAGLLSVPMFATDHSLSWTVSYGSVGIILNRLMTHSIDDLGGMYDEHGNFHDGWISQSTAYMARRQCFVNQFDKYYEHVKHLDGELVVRDIVTDQSGIKHAFKAYKNWMWDKDLEEDRSKLPGLNVTHHQLFFLSFAQANCDYQSLHSAVSSVETPHVYMKHRINGALINSLDFSKAFDCKLDEEAMNPSDKCILW